MNLDPWLTALAGGALIGLGTATLWLWEGRTAGVSGIVGGLLDPEDDDRRFRLAFLLGLLLGGAAMSSLLPAAFGGGGRPLPLLLLSGLLVGYGTGLGSGCTSGHGVCGMARRSPRSAVATATFMATGAVAATLVGLLTRGDVA